MSPLASWEWREAFLEHGDADPYTRLVGLVVSHYANVVDSEQAHPGLANLERATGLDKRTIRNRLTALEQSDWIERTCDGGSPKNGVRLAREWALSLPTAARLGTPGVTSETDGLGTPGARLGTPGVTSETDGLGTPGVTSGDDALGTPGARLGTPGALDQVHGVHALGTWDVPPPLHSPLVSPLHPPRVPPLLVCEKHGEVDEDSFCQQCNAVLVDPRSGRLAS